jgi:hypothetical protein
MKLNDFIRVEENFADGKNPGRKGLSQRVGIPKNATISQLEKHSTADGEKGRMARWQLNMRRGKNNESIETSDLTEILKVFLPIAKEILKLDRLPKIILKKNLSYDKQPSQGRFDSELYQLELSVGNRQPVDILRTLAHELVHAKQDSEHVEIDGSTGSEHENEANALAGVIMRHFNQMHPEFLKAKPVSEGGNLQIGDKAADQINLQIQNRSAMVKLLDELLHAINTSYAKTYKIPLWSPELIQSREFLSGSSLHFFNVKGIPDETFVAKKPKVGDIDTQVDKQQEENLEKFLGSIQGKQLGPATFVGFQRGNEQFSSLWEFQDPPIKIQIDLEFVEYNQGKPTEWSQFSHSSSWDDLSAGVKGVFHKYLMRAFTTNTLRTRYIQTKTGKLQAKPITSTDIAFAVSSSGTGGGGMREKYAPVIDPSTGKQKQVDGIPVYSEIAAGDSTYVNNINNMFEMIFGQTPSEQDAKLLWSYTGGLQLANKYLDQAGKEKLANGFLMTLFSPGAQGLYRGDPKRDYAEKMAAWDLMLQALQLPETFKTKAEQDATAYYEKYKVTAESINEDVKASPRQGIQHLEKMNDLEFINFVKKLKHEMKGKLNPIKMTLKVDGLGARFGKDKSGKPFFESSHSGPIFTSGTFTGYAQGRGFEGEKLQRAAHYDQIFDMIVNSKFIQQLPNDTKVNCEILYNPMADETDNGLKFVTVAYDRSVLGPMMTIVPFDSEVASTGQRHPMSNKIKDFLIKIKGEGDIKFVDDRLGYDGDVDLSAQIDPILSIIDGTLIAKLSSRLKVDADEKRQIKAFLQAAKDSIAQYLLQHPGIIGKDRMGKDIEGVILHRGKEAPIKVTTPTFKQAMADKRSAQQGTQNATEPTV